MEKRKTERVRQLRRRREAKAQHPQTYGCLLLDYTSAGWKITSSVCVCVSPPAYAHVYVCVCIQELTLEPAEDYSIPLNFCVCVFETLI